MTPDTAQNAPQVGAGAGFWTALGVAAALLFFLVSGAVSYSNVQTLQADNDKIVHSHDVIAALDSLLALVEDAETGQRGFLLTGSDRYLQPYDNAVPKVAPTIS